MSIDQFSRSLPMVLHRVLDVVMPRFRSIFNEFGLTEQQWRVLRVLLDTRHSSLRELAELTLIAPPSLVGVVDRLAAAGLVTRQRDSSDRRVVVIAPTRDGRALVSAILPRVARVYADLKRSVDPATWEDVLNGLEQISERARHGNR